RHPEACSSLAHHLDWFGHDRGVSQLGLRLSILSSMSAVGESLESRGYWYLHRAKCSSKFQLCSGRYVGSNHLFIPLLSLSQWVNPLTPHGSLLRLLLG